MNIIVEHRKKTLVAKGTSVGLEVGEWFINTNTEYYEYLQTRIPNNEYRIPNNTGTNASTRATDYLMRTRTQDEEYKDLGQGRRRCGTRKTRRRHEEDEEAARGRRGGGTRNPAEI